MRAARKIVQQPRSIGIGLCFEPALVDPLLAERTKRLCERIGYYGVFELEFILAEGKAMLIDFNGRFYHQMAFDIEQAKLEDREKADRPGPDNNDVGRDHAVHKH